MDWTAAELLKQLTKYRCTRQEFDASEREAICNYARRVQEEQLRMEGERIKPAVIAKGKVIGKDPDEIPVLEEIVRQWQENVKIRQIPGFSVAKVPYSEAGQRLANNLRYTERNVTMYGMWVEGIHGYVLVDGRWEEEYTPKEIWVYRRPYYDLNDLEQMLKCAKAFEKAYAEEETK